MFQTITPRQTIISLIALSSIIVIGAVIITIKQINTNNRLSFVEGKVS